MLRADIQQAGFGLPWNIGANNYNEAVNDLPTFWTALMHGQIIMMRPAEPSKGTGNWARSRVERL